jgi:hypothetical protein
MTKPYISEFETFMNQFLQSHPEVIEEQRRNWRSFWEPEIHHETAHPRKEDLVPDDQYGFRWRPHKPH